MLVLRQNTIFTQLALQVFCHSEHLDLERQGLLKLPIPLMPKVALTLLELFYKTHVCIAVLNFLSTLIKIKNKKVNDWARERGFSIEKSVFLGPQILWLQTGDIRTQHDRVSIVIFIPRPKIAKEEEENAVAAEEITTGTTPAWLREPPFRILIKSPISGPLLAESPVECEVGDVVILEGGEQLWVRADESAALVPSDVCMICALHRTSTVDAGKKDNDER